MTTVIKTNYLPLPRFRAEIYWHCPPLLLPAQLNRLPYPAYGRGPRPHVRGQQGLHPVSGPARHQQGATHSKRWPTPLLILARPAGYCMSSTKTNLLLSLLSLRFTGLWLLRGKLSVFCLERISTWVPYSLNHLDMWVSCALGVRNGLVLKELYGWF